MSIDIRLFGQRFIFQFMYRSGIDSSFTWIEFYTKTLGKYMYWFVWRKSPSGTDYAVTILNKPIKKFNNLSTDFYPYKPFRPEGQ